MRSRQKCLHHKEMSHHSIDEVERMNGHCVEERKSQVMHMHVYSVLLYIPYIEHKRFTVA